MQAEGRLRWNVLRPVAAVAKIPKLATAFATVMEASPRIRTEDMRICSPPRSQSATRPLLSVYHRDCCSFLKISCRASRPAHTVREVKEIPQHGAAIVRRPDGRERHRLGFVQKRQEHHARRSHQRVRVASDRHAVALCDHRQQRAALDRETQDRR